MEVRRVNPLMSLMPSIVWLSCTKSPPCVMRIWHLSANVALWLCFNSALLWAAANVLWDAWDTGSYCILQWHMQCMIQ